MPIAKIPPLVGLDVALEEAMAAEERLMANRGGETNLMGYRTQNRPVLQEPKSPEAPTIQGAPRNEIIAPEIQAERDFFRTDILDLLDEVA